MTTTRLPSLTAVGRTMGSVRAGQGERWGWVAVVAVVLLWGATVPLGFTRAVAALTAFGFLGAVVGLVQPAVGVVSIALLCTLDAPARAFLTSGGLFRWNTLNYWLLLVAGLAIPRLTRLRDGPTRLLELLALLIGLEILISTDPELGLQHLINLLGVFGMLAYTVAVGTRQDVWSWVGLIGGASGAAGGLAYFVQGRELVVMNPNAWSYLPLGALLTICLGFSQSENLPRRRMVLGWLAGLNVAWVFLSGSRGSLLVALCCVGYLFAATTRFSGRAIMVATAAVVLLAASSIFTDLQEHSLGRLLKLLNPAVSLTERTSGRFDLMLGGLYIFESHPLGVGTGGFGAAWAELGSREGLSGFGRNWSVPAHAGWIKTLAENGAPGALLLAGLVLSFAVTAVAVRDRGTRRLGYLTAVALATAWISTEFQARSLWLLAAGTASLLRAHRCRQRTRLDEAAAATPGAASGPPR